MMSERYLCWQDMWKIKTEVGFVYDFLPATTCLQYKELSQ